MPKLISMRTVHTKDGRGEAMVAKEYQPKSNKLPYSQYMRVIYAIRDYGRIKAEYEAIVESSPAPPDGMPGGSKVSDPTADKAIRLEDLGRQMREIEAGLNVIPEEYRRQIYNNIVFRIPYDVSYTSYSTYRYWKQKMIMTISREMRL